jgi:outer membrane lipoprotein-sorting protein
MKIRKIARFLLVFLAAAAALFAQTADELVAKNLAARGGADKLRAIRTMALTGTVSFGEQSSRITVKAWRPNQIREEFKVQGTEVTRAYDGTIGWQIEKSGEESKVDLLRGGEADNIREEAENAIEGPLVDYAKKGSKLEALGRDTVGGTPVYKLKITTHLGTSITQFLDATSYLEMHEEIERTVDGKLTTIVEDVSDYHDAGGIKFAHRFVSGSKENPQATTLQVDKMELNVPIEASAFAMPK